jgi:hypothetical protein
MSGPEQPAEPARSQAEPAGLRVVALVTASLSTASVLAWPLGAFVSVFFFDAPGSEDNRVLVALAWAIWTYGPVALVGGVTAFICIWRKRYRAAALIGAAPFLHALVVVGLFVALQVLCGGKTRC